MFHLQIRRQRNPSLDQKQALRAHVDQLTLDRQRAFVPLAFQLIAVRAGMSKADITTAYQQPLQ